jgi:protocatechuate 3,4-dioxygenase beta subunit
LGTVTDPAGDTVAHAKVTATEVDTAIARDIDTNESGNYSFPDLQPGRYSINISAPGFKKDTHQNVDVIINSSTRVDVSLLVGSASVTVTRPMPRASLI